jgi:hypothetical protein
MNAQGDGLELLGVTERIVVLEGERRLSFTFEEMSRYNGGGSPGGVAHAFKLLELAGSAFGDGQPLQRRALSVRTAFGGPGARDGFELVTRAATEGRYEIDPVLARPELGTARQRFVFALGYLGRTVWLTLNEGFVTLEFVELAGLPDRTPAQEGRLDAMKAAMAEQLMATPADIVYTADPVPEAS